MLCVSFALVNLSSKFHKLSWVLLCQDVRVKQDKKDSGVLTCVKHILLVKKQQFTFYAVSYILFYVYYGLDQSFQTSLFTLH